MAWRMDINSFLDISGEKLCVYGCRRTLLGMVKSFLLGANATWRSSLNKYSAQQVCDIAVQTFDQRVEFAVAGQMLAR